MGPAAKKDNNRDVALKYLRCFCSGDVDGLAVMLAPELVLRGTLYEFDSRDAYLAGLRRDPPAACEFRVRSITEAGEHVALFYDYVKPDDTVTVAQLLRITDSCIREILVVFDGRGATPAVAT